MEEEHSTINNSNEFVPLTSSSNSRRLQIRRNILRQTTTLRSSPYNSTLSSLRRRRQQNSLIASQTINNLITNIEHNNNIQTDINTSLNDIETIDEHFLNTSDEENNHEDFQVLVDLSNTSPIDLIITNENNNSNESYHSLSTIDFDPEDDDDDDDDHYYHYSSSTIESIITPTNPLNIIQYPYDDDVDNDDGGVGGEYSPSINNNNINDEEEEEDLSIEIILESSQNNSISRRRRSIIPSNNSGLRLSDILNIPQKLYSSLYNDKYTMNTQCYICLEDFQLIDSIKILHCQHIFHTACINEWLRCHSNCAYCRTIVVIDMLRTTAGRRQRTRTRRNIIRSSTNHSIESSTFEQQQP